MNAAQERFVDEILRLDVGRKDHQRHERQIELLPRLQRQEVDAAFERHDPAVQQLARRARLPAEIVDDQHAAVGDRLHGRPVEPHRRAVAQLELVQRQLAAHHDHRTAAADPAAIVVVAEIQAVQLPVSGSGS